MTESQSRYSMTLEETQAQAAKAINESGLSTHNADADADMGTNVEPEGKTARDQVDEAAAEAPKKTDELHPGTVQVAETGDLHDLAARRQSGC